MESTGGQYRGKHHRQDRLIRPKPSFALLAALIAAPGTAIGAIAAVLRDNRELALAGILANALCQALLYMSVAARHRRYLVRVLDHARRDAVTGLPNRAVAEEMLTQVGRDRTDVTIALIDLDGLHGVNRTFGHAAGDQYLAAVAAELAALVPPGGCAARQGGDEFILIIPGMAPERLSTVLDEALAGSIPVGNDRIPLRASVGIAPSAGGDPLHTRACADAAMCTAKAAGGDRRLIYQPERDGQPWPDGSRRQPQPDIDRTVVLVTVPG